MATDEPNSARLNPVLPVVAPTVSGMYAVQSLTRANSNQAMTASAVHWRKSQKVWVPTWNLLMMVMPWVTMGMTATAQIM